MRIRTALLTLTLIALALSALPGQAAEGDYKEYRKTNSRSLFFTLSFDKRSVYLEVEDGGRTISLEGFIAELDQQGDEITIGPEITFGSKSVTIGSVHLDYSDISDTRIKERDGLTTILFYTGSDDEGRGRVKRRGNLIEPTDDIEVQSSAFIRGIIFSVTGGIEVYGEVNKDIISLFGDIYIGGDAVARGDVVSLAGSVHLSKSASVYGEVYSSKRSGKGRSRRFYQRSDRFNINGELEYNRVDGLTPFISFGFNDDDGLLPSVDLAFGYAFEPKRSRWQIEIDQPLLNRYSISIGGAAYRKLASDDAWIIGKSENMFFTSMWNEDFLDYYEAEGGRVWLKASPVDDLAMEFGYLHEETDWLPAERDLWSLFGGDKKFEHNFGRVQDDFRANGMTEIDTSTNAAFYAVVDYDSRDLEHPFDASAWAITGEAEISKPSLKSDFDFKKYTFSARRYQLINRKAMLIARFRYGTSEGYLPMHRRFYLGGLGTLRGYKHKELMGTKYWMANAEYRIRFPRTDIAFSLLYDAAQLANETNLSDDVEVKQSLGAALYVGDDLRLSWARRLDESDASIQFYVRLKHTF
ncbi:MAG: BamA/TamA family outer membrane protein [candidate division Zixibacteria bacterium]